MKKTEFDLKYAKLIIDKCIVNDESKKLLIIIDNIDTFDFAKKVYHEAQTRNISQISIFTKDKTILHDYLNDTYTYEIKINPLIDYSVVNEYAKNKDNILTILSPIPGLMDDIDINKLSRAYLIESSTKLQYIEDATKYTFPWCVTCYPNKLWAEKVFPNDPSALNKLYYLFMKTYLIDTDSPSKSWNNVKNELNYYKNILNKLKIETLKFRNSLGTNLTISLPNDSVFLNLDKSEFSSSIINNLPSREIFTSPLKTGTNGIVYNSKPLVYNDKIIDDFYFVFENGKIVYYKAKTGQELLDQIFKTYKNINYLGKVALVEQGSYKEGNNKLFYETLLDKNTSCHLGLGNSFAVSIENGQNMEKADILENDLNVSLHNIDFVIGTDDLEIAAISSNKFSRIFKNGKFVL